MLNLDSMSAFAISMIPVLSQTERSAHFMVNNYAKRGKKGMELEQITKARTGSRIKS
jgi:hypothetical protein